MRAPDYKSFILLFILLIPFFLLGQVNNPSVNGVISFEQYPADLSTGIPDIKIPLYSLPTRAKELTVNLSLNYHPSSVATFNDEFGDCGHGWSIQKGGVIFKTYSLNADISTSGVMYEFRFMGHSGKFLLKLVNNELEITVTENQGVPLAVEVDYDNTTNIISSFSIYDDYGYRYEFDVADKMVFPFNGNSSDEFNSGFHLSKVFDNNNFLLLEYEFNTYYRVLEYHQQGQMNTLNLMKKIISPGFGEIELSGLPTNLSTLVWGTPTFYSLQYLGLIVKNFKNEVIKELIFHLDTIQDKPKLVALEQVSNALSQFHYFEYKEIDTDLTLEETVGVDKWGYYNIVNSIYGNQLSDLASPYALNGVLQKIMFPSGGCVLYDFELNTYYYTNRKPLDTSFSNGVLVTDENFFTNLNLPNNAGQNNHNFNTSTFASKNFRPNNQSPLFFNLNTTQELFFRFDGILPYTYIEPGITDENGNPITITIHPLFRLKKDGVIIQTFSHNTNYDNPLNSGFGRSLTLQSGTYEIEIINGNETSGNVKVNEVTPKSTIKKWWYGGGIRIKKIGYFEEDVPKNYYEELLDEPAPIREIGFNFNLFDEPNKSSGYLKVSYDFDTHDLVRYKNVTITDSNKPGKIQHEYFSPIENASNNIIHDYREGNLEVEKVYNSNNQLVLETRYDYTVSLQMPIFRDDFEIGFNLPREIVEKKYLQSGIIETTTKYSYNLDRKIRDVYQYTSISSDSLHSRMFYHKENSVFSKNRNIIERIENRRNGQLLGETKIEYQNTWPLVAEDSNVSNVSYLPTYTLTSKENHTPFIGEKVNLYDKYGNVIEYESPTGVKSVNIWGYNKTLLVAKIENASYNSINQSLITDLQQATNSGTESDVLNALNALRNAPSLQNSMVTTFVYKPLVGVRIVTDPKGDSQFYEYDSFNRLERVLDREGNVLSKNEYYYRTQQ